MSTQSSPDGDELRARAYLRALRARPFGHQEPPMPPEPEKRPITPTRIIPAAAPLPARPPQPGERPPWYPPPAPPPVAPPPPPAPIEVRHVHEVLLVVPDTEDEPPTLWERLWDKLATWRMLVALLLALLPWAGGNSPVGIWSRTVHQARTEAGISAAYIVASVAVVATWALDRSTGRFLPRFLFVTASLGAFGVLHWYDPILLLTGVTR
ncbi:hypothetical protein [Streptomyces sp. NPDC057623]|uniref:hypothetical protein n=1 Tax=Streptomyces sp. NPDC057623 TaxID=3346187 RepID=UPI0036BB60D7